MRHYIVCYADDPNDYLELVSVKGYDELLDFLFEMDYREGCLVEYLEDMIINGSILTKFLNDEHGFIYSEYKPGGLRDDLERRFKDDVEAFKDYADSWVQKNVREYFDHQHYADLYLQKYYGDDVEFPKDMYKYVYLKEKWYESMIIKEVSLTG